MEWKKQAPNVVSASRLVCGLMALMCTRRNRWRAALGWLLIGEVTDNADGRLARKFNAVTPLGSDILEPGCDTALTKLAEIGLILQGHLSWRTFWGVNALGGVLLVPLWALPEDHPAALRCDTAIGFVYVGELAWCSWKYAQLAEARTLLRWGPLGLPVVAWLSRRTMTRWARQLL